jgi:hypothetical protein
VALGALHRDDTDRGASVVAQLCVRRSPVHGRPARGIWSEGAGEAASVVNSPDRSHHGIVLMSRVAIMTIRARRAAV